MQQQIWLLFSGFISLFSHGFTQQPFSSGCCSLYHWRTPAQKTNWGSSAWNAVAIFLPTTLTLKERGWLYPVWHKRPSEGECCVGPVGPDLCKAGALRRYRPAMLGRAQISISGFAGGAQKRGLELRWRCGVSRGGDGWQLRRLAHRAAAWARPHIPRSTGGEIPRWVYVSTVYFVTQAVAEQQGGRRAASKPYLCPPTRGARGAEDGWGWLQGTGWGRQKGEVQQWWRT